MSFHARRQTKPLLCLFAWVLHGYFYVRRCSNIDVTWIRRLLRVAGWARRGSFFALFKIQFQGFEEDIFLTGRNGEGYAVLQNDVPAFAAHIFLDMAQVYRV